MYALLELADRATYSHEPLAGLVLPHPVSEQPANRIRSVARLFVSEVVTPNVLLSTVMVIGAVMLVDRGMSRLHQSS